MKFGKTIETSARELPEEWQPYIIQYKLLKKNIKQIVEELDKTFRTLNLTLPDGPSEDHASDKTDREATDTQATIEQPSSSAKKDDSNDSDDDAALKAAKTSFPEGIEYNIEKDSQGVVHPVITVTIRRPASGQNDRIVELPAISRVSSNSAAFLHPGSSEDSADSESASFDSGDISVTDSSIPIPILYGGDVVNHGCSLPEKNNTPTEPFPTAKEKIRIETKVVEDTEEMHVTVRLETDQMFFDQLLNYISRMRSFEKTYTKQYNTNVVSLGSDLTTVTSPFKHDFEVWREIFRLYIDANVWDHSDGDSRSAHSAKEGQDRFAKFTHHIEDIGLTKKLRDPHSARILMSFYKLNIELSHLRLLQEMNELATRKIIKKHDKRTHLIAKTQFPQIVNIDATTLTRALIYTVYNDLVGVVPQLDDYLCPMCLNISWRPLRLDCGHVFCSRCVVKASRRRIFDCPLCRSKRAIYNASVGNIDNALLNFLKLYFPKEIKEKQREIQREISEEEATAIVQAHNRERPCIIM